MSHGRLSLFYFVVALSQFSFKAQGLVPNRCRGSLEFGNSSVTCIEYRGWRDFKYWTAPNPDASRVLIDSSSMEDTLVNCGDWPNVPWPNLQFGVINGDGTAAEGFIDMWTKVRFNATELKSVSASQIADVFLFVKGGLIGNGGTFEIIDGPARWNETNVTCAELPSIMDEPYNASLRIRDEHEPGWWIMNITAPVKYQYPFTREVNLVWSAASRETAEMFWYSANSNFPPYVWVELR